MERKRSLGGQLANLVGSRGIYKVEKEGRFRGMGVHGLFDKKKTAVGNQKKDGGKRRGTPMLIERSS